MKSIENSQVIPNFHVRSTERGPTLSKRFQTCRDTRGFTLLELLLVSAILAILMSIFIPMWREYQVVAGVSRAMSDIRTIETTISAYVIEQTIGLPPNLTQIGYGNLLDPWGRPYEYRVSGTRTNLGTDLNGDYDLFSTGPDVDWKPSINANESLDDIVRGDNGHFVGKAEDYL